MDDPLRRYLAGDVLPMLRELFERAEAQDGTIYAALYELSDPELIDLLAEHAGRLHLILSTAGKDKDSGEWDTTNVEARQRLRKAIGTKQLQTRSMQDRMFNTSAGIGHNKFAVLVVDGQPEAVWTGSTNWTPTGLCAQTNNTIVFRSPDVAQHYLDYWNRLHEDKQPVPKPLSRASNASQGAAVREANGQPFDASVDGGATRVQLWFSPNTPKRGTPATRTVPPDLEVLFDLMSKARHAIFFLVFNPGRTAEDQQDANTAVSAALAFGRHRPDLFVAGAISDPAAMPGYTPRDPAAPKAALPAIYTPAGAPNVLMVRAASLQDPVGNVDKELLKIGHAIVHDKVVVIDPMSEDCVVVAGSHNLGFKASYANDENLTLIRGNRALACAYAVHVLDVYEHYCFRAVQEEIRREAMIAGKSVEKAVDQGFLKEDDTWQDKYVEPGPADLRWQIIDRESPDAEPCAGAPHQFADIAAGARHAVDQVVRPHQRGLAPVAVEPRGENPVGFGQHRHAVRCRGGVDAQHLGAEGGNRIAQGPQHAGIGRMAQYQQESARQQVVHHPRRRIGADRSHGLGEGRAGGQLVAIDQPVVHAG